MQLVTDFLCAKFKNLDYRKAIIASEVTSALGLAGLAFLPQLFPHPMVGIFTRSADIQSGLLPAAVFPMLLVVNLFVIRQRKA